MRPKKNPNMPSGLTSTQRKYWRIANGLCAYCGANNVDADSPRHYCYECLEKMRTSERISKKRKTKEDAILKCVTSADELGLSYGQYMLLKRGDK